jgi:DNA-binding response OmpR family regulator
LRDTLAEQLRLSDGFEILTAGTAMEAADLVKAERIDLGIMDVGLPDMDGRDAVRMMRRDGFRGPIIMLTAQGSDADTVMGLDSGANDYVVKPFKFSSPASARSCASTRPARTRSSASARTPSGRGPKS